MALVDRAHTSVCQRAHPELHLLDELGHEWSNFACHLACCFLHLKTKTKHNNPNSLPNAGACKAQNQLHKLIPSKLSHHNRSVLKSESFSNKQNGNL